MKRLPKQTSKLSHEEYIVLQRKRVVQLANRMLNEEIGLIEGVRLLSTLRWEVTDDQFDPDFLFFIGIDSETDALPIGEERRHWADYALVEKDKEIKKNEDFYRMEVFASCKVLIERFSTES